VPAVPRVHERYDGEPLRYMGPPLLVRERLERGEELVAAGVHSLLARQAIQRAGSMAWTMRYVLPVGEPHRARDANWCFLR
jgi:hypothetical protein